MRHLTLLALLCLLIQCCSSLQQLTSASQNNLYSTYWDKLLVAEHQQKKDELRERRRTWSRRRLEESGLGIFGASAEPDSEIFGEKIVRVCKQGETRLRDRFARGDLLVMTPIDRGRQPVVPRECLVVDVGKDWLTAGVGPSWPHGLWEARRLAGCFEVQLDRTAPQAPLLAQRHALNLVRLGKAGEAAAVLVNLFCNAPISNDNMASEAPSRFSRGFDLHKKVWDALDEATDKISFKPNQSQKYAIAWSLQRRISLIRGPPGTGKTRVAALLISTALRLRPTTADVDVSPVLPRVLAVAHSNGAADVLLEALLEVGVPAIRVGRPASVSPNVLSRTVVAMTEKMPEVVRLRQRASDSTLDSHLRSAARFEIKQCMNDLQEAITKAAPVVVTTCIGALQLLNKEKKVSLGDDVTFPLVVLDEAAHTTEPALLCALAAARAEQVILVGDTRQLPPTVTSMELRDTLGVSPMARLERNGVGQKTLQVQYRMPPTLLQHPSQYFYNGLVSCATETSHQAETPPPDGFPWPDFQPLAFIQVGRGDCEIVHNFGGRSNPTEAELVASVVSDLLAAEEVDATNIAVISPYSKQVQRIRTELSYKRNLQGVQVGTVDSFQGQEADVVVFSAVRSNPVGELGFLRDQRRLCVAITRARRGLILMGDQTVLRSCRHWAALIDSCEERGCCLNARDLDDIVPNPLVSGVNHESSIFSVPLEEGLHDLFDNNDESSELCNKQ